MNVHITYFKANGKYYSQADHALPDYYLTKPLFEAWHTVQAIDPAPGLTSSGDEFVWLIEVQDHPNAHPVLYNTVGAVLEYTTPQLD